MRTAEQVRYLVLAAQREGNRQLTALLSPFGLTPAQAEALRIIDEHGPLALRELGDMLVCDTGASPSRIVDRLVAAGLVRRDASERDRRRVRLSLTAQGAERAGQVRDVEGRLSDWIDGELDDDVDALVRILQVMTEGSAARVALDARLAAEAAAE